MLLRSVGVGERQTQVGAGRISNEWHGDRWARAFARPGQWGHEIREAGGGGDAGRDVLDEWYADMATSPVRDAIVARTLGLPAELQSTSLLTWRGIGEVTDALGMPQEGLLLDIACGRGGYRIEVARRTGASLLGVDFSGVAGRVRTTV